MNSNVVGRDTVFVPALAQVLQDKLAARPPQGLAQLLNSPFLPPGLITAYGLPVLMWHCVSPPAGVKSARRSCACFEVLRVRIA